MIDRVRPSTTGGALRVLAVGALALGGAASGCKAKAHPLCEPFASYGLPASKEVVSCSADQVELKYDSVAPEPTYDAAIAALKAHGFHEVWVSRFEDERFDSPFVHHFLRDADKTHYRMHLTPLLGMLVLDASKGIILTDDEVKLAIASRATAAAYNAQLAKIPSSVAQYDAVKAHPRCDAAALVRRDPTWGQGKAPRVLELDDAGKIAATNHVFWSVVPATVIVPGPAATAKEMLDSALDVQKFKAQPLIVAARVVDHHGASGTVVGTQGIGTTQKTTNVSFDPATVKVALYVVDANDGTVVCSDSAGASNSSHISSVGATTISPYDEDLAKNLAQSITSAVARLSSHK
jgi:hypothetical protein